MTDTTPSQFLEFLSNKCDSIAADPNHTDTELRIALEAFVEFRSTLPVEEDSVPDWGELMAEQAGMTFEERFTRN